MAELWVPHLGLFMAMNRVDGRCQVVESGRSSSYVPGLERAKRDEGPVGPSRAVPLSGPCWFVNGAVRMGKMQKKCHER